MKFKRLLRTCYNQIIIEYIQVMSILGLGGLPDFVIIGAQKGGTTSLYQYLLSHPQILGAKMKELHYFSANYHRGIHWYKACFPNHEQRIRQSEKIGRPVFTGEASPNYLFNPDTPKLLAATLPNAKFIALLRNPVDRLISHYQHMLRIGWETLPIKEAIAHDEEHLSREASRQKITGHHLRSFYQPETFSYLARGRYIEQLERYSSHFKKDQMLILKSENFFANTQTEYDKILEFLGAAPHTPGEFKIANKGTYSKREQYTELKQELREYFKPYNERLYEFLGTDLNW